MAPLSTVWALRTWILHPPAEGTPVTVPAALENVERIRVAHQIQRAERIEARGGLAPRFAPWWPWTRVQTAVDLAAGVAARTSGQRAETLAETARLTAEADAALIHADAIVKQHTADVERLTAERDAARAQADTNRTQVGDAAQDAAESHRRVSELTSALEKLRVELRSAEMRAQTAETAAERAAETHRVELVTQAAELRAAFAERAAETWSTVAVERSGDRAERPRRDSGETEPSGRKPVISDEDAVELMLDAHGDPRHEWKKNHVIKLTGVGWGRVDTLIKLWAETAGEAKRRAAGELSEPAESVAGG